MNNIHWCEWQTMVGIKTMGNDRQWDITMLNNLHCELITKNGERWTMGSGRQWGIPE